MDAFVPKSFAIRATKRFGVHKSQVFTQANSVTKKPLNAQDARQPKKSLTGTVWSVSLTAALGAG